MKNAGKSQLYFTNILRESSDIQKRKKNFLRKKLMHVCCPVVYRVYRPPTRLMSCVLQSPSEEDAINEISVEI